MFKEQISSPEVQVLIFMNPSLEADIILCDSCSKQIL